MLQVFNFFVCLNYFNHKNNEQTKGDIISHAYCRKVELRQRPDQDCNIWYYNFCEKKIFVYVYQ